MTYLPTSFHAIKVGGKTVKEPKTLASWWFGGVIDWLSPTVALATDGTDTAGATDLQAIDISTGKLKHLWKDLYGNCIVDHENRLIALISSEFTKEDNWGFYFLTFDGKLKKISDGWYFNLLLRGGSKDHFRALRFSDPKGEIGVSLDGMVSELTLPGGNTSVSPDHSWMVIYDEKGFSLYDKNDVLVKSFSVSHFEKIIWRTDSQGFFYSAWDTDSYLAYLPIPSGEPVTIDRCITENCSFDLDTKAAWLP
jgi:hypothetical protein